MRFMNQRELLVRLRGTRDQAGKVSTGQIPSERWAKWRADNKDGRGSEKGLVNVFCDRDLGDQGDTCTSQPKLRGLGGRLQAIASCAARGEVSTDAQYSDRGYERLRTQNPGREGRAKHPTSEEREGRCTVGPAGEPGMG